jgi:hypothetical protein
MAGLRPSSGSNWTNTDRCNSIRWHGHISRWSFPKPLMPKSCNNGLRLSTVLWTGKNRIGSIAGAWQFTPFKKLHSSSFSECS